MCSHACRAVWLGFVANVTMIGFFLFEKLISMVGEMKQKRSEDRKLRVVREGHAISDKVRI